MLAVAALPGVPIATRAQSATPAEGRRIAERYCSRCHLHVVAPGGGTGWTGAPTFADIAQDPRIFLA